LRQGEAMKSVDRTCILPLVSAPMNRKLILVVGKRVGKAV
jgi:hypothetical protein